ncbi:MAG: Flp family type IVb pilin [Candidatus Binataceae bacterium]
MNWTARIYLRLREKTTSLMRRDLSQGQTMTEYALIMAAIAVAVYGTYSLMGTDIKALVGSINADLVPA